MQALREAEEANLELSGAQRLSWAAFGRSRALESTATGTMLSARRSRFFASASRRERPLLRREERRRTTVAFSAQPSNPARMVPFHSPTFKIHKQSCGRSFCTTWLCILLVLLQTSIAKLRLSFQHSEAKHSTNVKGTVGSNFLCLHSFFFVEKGGKAFDEDAVLHRSRRGQSGAVRSSAPVVGSFRQEPRFGEHCYRHNAQCAKKPLLRLRQWRERPLLRREERRRTTVAFSAQPSNPARTVPFQSPTF
ncbi:unnamed protein product [Coccothraustes coccothraustes]